MTERFDLGVKRNDGLSEIREATDGHVYRVIGDQRFEIRTSGMVYKPAAIAAARQQVANGFDKLDMFERQAMGPDWISYCRDRQISIA